MNSTQLAAMAVAAIGCALALAACGAGANYNPEAATNPSTNGPLQLSECMHSHGIKSFPDPTNGSGGPGLSVAESPGSPTLTVEGITFSGPAFEAAEKACSKLLPGGHGPPPPLTAQQKQHALAQAACIRKHGVPNFPDPTFPTGAGPAGRAASHPLAGIDTSSPAFQNAVHACGGSLEIFG